LSARHDGSDLLGDAPFGVRFLFDRLHRGEDGALGRGVHDVDKLSLFPRWGLAT
jgi:hypothetical protein